MASPLPHYWFRAEHTHDMFRFHAHRAIDQRCRDAEYRRREFDFYMTEGAEHQPYLVSGAFATVAPSIR